MPIPDGDGLSSLVLIPYTSESLSESMGTMTNIRVLDPATPESHQMLYLPVFSAAPSLFWVHCSASCFYPL